MKLTGLPFLRTAAVLLPIGACNMSDNLTLGAIPSPKTILLDGGRVLRSLGGSIPVTVRYENRGTAVLSFRQPEKTWEVHLLIGARNVAPVEEAIGRIFYSNIGGIVRRTVEDATTITLAPGRTYEFQFDPGQRWPELFVPGVNVLQVKDLSDDAGDILSNAVEIRVVYDAATFPALLAIAGQDNATLDSRQFAAEWIRRVYPDFSSIGEAAASSQQLAEAQAWWRSHRNDSEVQRRIEELNRPAGSPQR
jgi:hypothetical protein